jgi:uroporphyrinogen-III synthase
MVTRPEQQADRLCRLIEKMGGSAVRFPVLEIIPVNGVQLTLKVVGKLQSFDWIVFVSANAVNFALRSSMENTKIPPQVNVAAVGRATAKALRKAGVRVDLLPETGFNSEALLATPELQQLEGQSVLIVRGTGGRELLADELRLRGARVEYLEVYKRLKPVMAVEPILKRLENNDLDVITVTSSEALQNLISAFDEKIKQRLLSIPLVVISERIKRLANKIGFKNIAVAAEPSDTAILDSVTVLINGEESG